MLSVGAGDKIYGKGSITDSFNISAVNSGTSTNFTTITNWPENTATLDATGFDYNIEIDDTVEYIEISGLNLTNADKSAIYSAGSISNINIINNNISDLTGMGSVRAIDINSADELILSGNDINGNNESSYGIDLFDSTNVSIEQNSVYGFTKIGIIFYADVNYSSVNNNFIYNIGGDDYFYSAGMVLADSNNDKIINNTFYNTYGSSSEVSGIMLMTSSDIIYDIEIENNIISKANYAINVDAYYSDVDIDYNDYYNVDKIGSGAGTEYDSLTEWQDGTVYDDHSINEDPEFTSTTSGSEDLHLAYTSSCIDAGTLNASITTDYDDEDRPYNITDIGADEDQTPDDPTSLTISNITTSSINLSWTASTKDVTGYTLEYDTDENFSNSPVLISDITEASYELSDLASNVTYFIRVNAVNQTSYQTYYTGLITASATTSPEAPTNLILNSRKSKKLEIAWEDTNNGTATYRIQYATDAEMTDAQNVESDETTLEITGLKPTKEYFFSITSCNVSENCSNGLTGSFRTNPKKVQNLKVLKNTLTNDSAKIRWQRQPRVSKYKIKITYKTDSNKTIKRFVTVKNNKTNKRITVKGDKIKIKKKLIKKLKLNRRYTVKVKAIYNSEIQGKYSKGVKLNIN